MINWIESQPTKHRAKKISLVNKEGIRYESDMRVVSIKDEKIKLRKKRVCGRCKELMTFPYVHCNIGEVLLIDQPNKKIFKAKPRDPESCRNARQLLVNQCNLEQEGDHERKTRQTPSMSV